jgi:uncharacterized protein (TIGR01777 family)
MKVLITGGTGFVGSALCHNLVGRGDELTVLTRNVVTAQQRVGVPVTAVESAGDADLASIDAVVNLAGLPIADRRWSDKRKQALYASRIGLTNQLLDALAEQKHRPRVLVSASAIGYYGDGGDSLLDEQSRPYPEFTHELCAAWEAAAMRAEGLGIRVCIIRIGLVMGPNGGMLKRLLPIFKMGAGGRLGSGQQWMSWVSLQDLVRIIVYLLDHDTLRGVFNATAPNPVRNNAFTEELAQVLKRPSMLPVPAPLLNLALGEMSQLMLTGQRVIPKRLQQAGFEFGHSTLREALIYSTG